MNLAPTRQKPSRAKLPGPRELERICKGLAALDAVMSEECESRYYSFDSAWTEGARMASMRNRSGNDWFIVFSPAGVFVKSFWHRHKRGDVAAIYAGLPATLGAWLTEPSFFMGQVTCGGWHDGKTWRLRGEAKLRMERLLKLPGAAEAYRNYAAKYFQLPDLPLDAITHVLTGKKFDAKLLARLRCERKLADLESELAWIGYGK